MPDCLSVLSVGDDVMLDDGVEYDNVIANVISLSKEYIEVRVVYCINAELDDFLRNARIKIPIKTFLQGVYYIRRGVHVIWKAD